MTFARLAAALLLSSALLLPGGAVAQTVQDDTAIEDEAEGAIELTPEQQPSVPVDPDDIVPETAPPAEPQPGAPGTDPALDELLRESPEDPEAVTPFATPAPGEPGPTRWGNLPELPVVGVPVQGGWNYPPAVGDLAREVHYLSHYIHVIMVAIVLFVSGLILYAIIRFNSKKNPTPARFTHNTRIEIAWTLGPVLILIAMASFSLPTLFRQLEIPEPDLTVKITGHQWFWTIEYPDNEFGFETFMLQRDELEQYGYSQDLFLLATDTVMVVPENTVVRLQVTSSDVIHAWAMPSFASKMDGIPGRLNETWFAPDRVGLYFGQCSELCGQGHAFMPITLAVVTQEDFDVWLDWAIDEYGGTRGDVDMAAAR
jgi:cytochrome c oxidase subunit II